MTTGLWGDLEFDAVDEFAAVAVVEAPAPDVPLGPEPDELDEEKPSDIVAHQTLDDGRVMSIDRKGRWFDKAGRKIIPIRGARIARLGEAGDILCPDCSSPLRWAMGVWRCPTGTRSHRFCGGLTIPARRRPKDKIKWVCRQCSHEWRSHKVDEQPDRCPECDGRNIRFDKRVSR